ncbi:MAG: mannose-1-phosphate guanylyltransferase/mannose-6-phosphate isomerase [Burkholderiales bacterium]
MSQPAIHPIVLCGGAGTRLWPMSRRLLPKQFLPLVSDLSMLQETVLRTQGVAGMRAPIVVGAEDHRFLVAEQLHAAKCPPSLLILEPAARNTAPAIAAAAWSLAGSDPNALMLVLPADHLIEKVAAFHAAIGYAATLAERDYLVTFGIVPTEPATGYGYIQRGDAIEAPGLPARTAFRVARFTEKPQIEAARKLVADGEHSWNSGMFMFRAVTFLEELARHNPAMHAATKLSWERAQRDMDFCRLDKTAFEASPSDSIDYAVMEKTSRAAMVPVDLGWSDVGAWSQLWQVGAKDGAGNVLHGDVLAHDTKNTYVRADQRLVATVGVEGLVIVETGDAVLVTTQDRAQDVKAIVDSLGRSGREEPNHHLRVYRPWGYYESIDSGARYQVKRIMVKPGQAISLQLHHHRAEHWIVVSGTAKVTRGDETILVSENESTFIPLGIKHRLENPGKVPVFLIEVQSGSYLGEDDIVRFQDQYGRG